MSQTELTRRVAITGLGALTAAGTTATATWDKVRAGDVCLSTVDRFDPAAFPSRSVDRSGTLTSPRRYPAASL